jgi:hypothetical protein
MSRYCFVRRKPLLFRENSPRVQLLEGVKNTCTHSQVAGRCERRGTYVTTVKICTFPISCIRKFRSLGQGKVPVI